jgi:hypothetical protein
MRPNGFTVFLLLQAAPAVPAPGRALDRQVCASGSLPARGPDQLTQLRTVHHVGGANAQHHIPGLQAERSPAPPAITSPTRGGVRGQ